MSLNDLLKALQILTLITAIGVMVSVAQSLDTIASPPTHNEEGGYIEACGDLPGLVGDDC